MKKIINIKFYIGKLATKILSILMKILKWTFLLLGLIFKLAGLILKPLRKAGFKIIILPFFAKYLQVQKKLSKKTPTKRGKLVLLFTNKYIIHALVIIIALGVTTSNILAYETQEDYGRNALIYDLIDFENLDVIEETNAPMEEPQVFSYVGESSQLTSKAFTEAQKKEEDIQELKETDLTTTQGGIALVKPKLVSTKAAKITRTSIKEYTVKEGDTIGGIAAQFGISVNTVLWANNLSSHSFIRPGQVLIIPPTSGVIHKIISGDTLSKIAAKYRANVATIKNFNNIEDESALAAGETIMVPGGQIVYTKKPRSYTTAPVAAPAYATPVVSTGGKMYWPNSCRRISQYYKGWIHTGIDIACNFGSPIRAAEAGKVTKVLYNRYGYGYHVIIDHGGGIQTLYGHLSRIYVKAGESVNKAQIIGLEGSTGRSTGPHLHFEVRVNGHRLNPLNYIR